ncbi:hypothetical protein EJB05_11509, partial [Eragrostis curvula]
MASSLLVRQELEVVADPLGVVANDGVLPTDLLTEVLLRVPAKALCCFRLVCRSWRLLTSDPCFARAHSSRHPLFAGRCYVEDGEYHLHIFDMSGNIVKRMCGLGDHTTHLSTHADLVCAKRRTLEDGDDGLLRQDLLLNPATDAIHVLPDVSIRSSQVTTCYLGRVPSTGEYKVLRVVQYYGGRGAEVMFAYEVITLDASMQSWRVRVAPDPPATGVLPYKRGMLVIREVAYFFSHGVDSVVMLDLETEEWRPSIVQCPPMNRSAVALYRLKGRLVLQNHNTDDCSMDLWFLMDVDKGLWTKRYSMHCGPNWKNHLYPLVVLDDVRETSCRNRLATSTIAFGTNAIQ